MTWFCFLKIQITAWEKTLQKVQNSHSTSRTKLVKTMVIKENIQVMKSLTKSTVFVESVLRCWDETGCSKWDWAAQLEMLQKQLQLWGWGLLMPERTLCPSWLQELWTPEVQALLISKTKVSCEQSWCKRSGLSLTCNLHPMAWQLGKKKTHTHRDQHGLNALFCLLYTLISQVFPDSYLVNTLGYLILICYVNCSFAIKFPSVFAVLLSWLTSLLYFTIN